MPNDEELIRLANDPALSYWFKNALVEALKRDPVDAAQDAGLLAVVLDRRAAEQAAATSTRIVIKRLQGGDLA